MGRRKKNTRQNKSATEVMAKHQLLIETAMDNLIDILSLGVSNLVNLRDTARLTTLNTFANDLFKRAQDCLDNGQ